jgi:hypothetical protein
MKGTFSSDNDLWISLSPIPALNGSIPTEFFGPASAFSPSGSFTGPYQGAVQFNLTAYIKWLMTQGCESSPSDLNDKARQYMANGGAS